MIEFAEMLKKPPIEGHTALLPFDSYSMMALVIITVKKFCPYLPLP